MPIRTEPAIVIRLSDYSETSQIVALFTAGEGLVRLIAKGVRRGTRKRFATGLDLLEYGEASYAGARQHGTLGTLTEWTQRDAFAGLRRGLLRLYGGLYAAELVRALTEEHDAHPALFDALLEVLRFLAGHTDPPAGAPAEPATPAAAIVRFQGALLKAIGYSPTLRRCANCGKARVPGTPAYFSARAGGFVCPDCATGLTEKRSIAPAMLDAGREAQRPVEWLSLLDYYLTHLAGRPFKAAGQLRRLLRADPLIKEN